MTGSRSDNSPRAHRPSGTREPWRLTACGTARRQRRSWRARVQQGIWSAAAQHDGDKEPPTATNTGEREALANARPQEVLKADVIAASAP